MSKLNSLKFIIALLVLFSVAFICSSSKDDKKEDTKKEDTKKDDTKKDDTKKDDTKKEDTKKDDTKKDDVGMEGAKLYFVEEYKDGKEVGKSDVFTIGPNGGYMTCMIDLKSTGKKIGVGKLDLRITKITDDGEKIIDTKPFDVQPDWDYIFFDQFYTFKSDGKFKITALKPDGTPVATGSVTIKYR
jgi:ABC-type Zn2+ transport system substrate-binding protein/surface adhesin